MADRIERKRYAARGDFAVFNAELRETFDCQFRHPKPLGSGYTTDLFMWRYSVWHEPDFIKGKAVRSRLGDHQMSEMRRIGGASQNSGSSHRLAGSSIRLLFTDCL